MSETLEPALPQELDRQAERAMRRLCDKKLTVATAESCTGGLLASLLTDIEGRGHGFDRGFVTYSGEAKQELLGVPAALVDRNDAVSAEVARAMAEGALTRCEADIALSVTGFAGPAPTRKRAWCSWPALAAVTTRPSRNAILAASAAGPSGSRR